ncbi:MAG: arginase family protein, partial [bacterium]|nr:arginase family protein [bacterium]
MDAQELARLRQRYQHAKGDDVFDPAFKQVVAHLYEGSGNRKLPFAGVSTLLDAPYQTELAGLAVALLGVPMDLGVTNRSGARFGPRAVRQVERIGPYNHQLKVAPLTTMQLADVGDVPLHSRYSLEQSIADIEAFYHQVCDVGVVPLSVGGDHSITYPILKALGRHTPVGMVHIDAHCDTGGEHDGSRFHHGGPFRQAVLDGVLDPARTIQIGIRGSSELFWEFSYDAG